MKTLLIIPIGFFIFLTITSSTFTNGLTGQVTEQKTNSPIAGAKVQLLKNGQTTEYSTATNLEGKFSIRNIPEGSYDIVIFHPSYARKQIKSVEINAKRNTNLSRTQLAIKPTQTEITERAHLQLKKSLPLNPLDTSSGPFPLPSGFYSDRRQNNSRGQMRGQVIEKKTKEPIFGSHVRLLLPDGISAKMRAISDDKGNFVILNVPPGNYQVEVSYGPMYTKQVIKDVKVEADRIFETGVIYLEEKPIKGDTIILHHRVSDPR